MIKYKLIELNTVDDYDEIKMYLKSPYVNIYTEIWLKEIKNRIGLKCTKLIIEYPYYDSDFLSTFYLYYIKKFYNYKKESVRIHFFSKENYMGYITLRPLNHYLNLGRSYLNPELLLTSNSYIMLSQYTSNCLGKEETILAFPWMHQETDITICAHIATWSILKYFGNEHKNYRDIKMGEVVEKVPDAASFGNRKTPSKGLNLRQIADIFKNYRLTPLVIRKEKGNENLFFMSIISYIESGIPMVAAINKKGHAISIIGHGNINYDNYNKNNKLHTSAEFIDSLIVNDDNYLPYLEIFKKDVDSNAKRDYNIPMLDYSIEDIDYIVVPLYDRIHLEFSSMYEKVKNFIKSGILNFQEEIIIRMYIASSNSFKKSFYKNDKVNIELRKVIRDVALPKFIWIVDISTFDEYKERLVSGKIIIDTTSCTKEDEPWLFLHDKNTVFYKDNDSWYKAKIDITPYAMYQKNLKNINI